MITRMLSNKMSDYKMLKNEKTVILKSGVKLRNNNDVGYEQECPRAEMECRCTTCSVKILVLI